MADANPVLAGTAFITVAGQRVAVAGEASYRISGENRESKVGQDGFHGVKVKPMPGQIKLKGRNMGNVPLASLDLSTPDTVVLELVNGKTVVGRNMTRVGDPLGADAEEAEIDITYEGPDVSEQ
ncbi:MAG: phage tail tube protein [Proteobacteria bacterium]|nr:phage tail tube protein [Pseudomonadota bacterium]